LLFDELSFLFWQGLFYGPAHDHSQDTEDDENEHCTEEYAERLSPESGVNAFWNSWFIESGRIVESILSSA